MFRKLMMPAGLVLFAASMLLAHGDYTHLMGTVTAVNGDHISMKDTSGKSIMVMTHKATKYLKDKKSAAPTDLKVGVRAVFDVKMDPVMKMYKADQVQIGVAAAESKD
jgi:hypothetical protein